MHCNYYFGRPITRKRYFLKAVKLHLLIMWSGGKEDAQKSSISLQRWDLDYFPNRSFFGRDLLKSIITPNHRQETTLNQQSLSKLWHWGVLLVKRETILLHYWRLNEKQIEASRNGEKETVFSFSKYWEKVFLIKFKHWLFLSFFGLP